MKVLGSIPTFVEQLHMIQVRSKSDLPDLQLVSPYCWVKKTWVLENSMQYGIWGQGKGFTWAIFSLTYGCSQKRSHHELAHCCYRPLTKWDDDQATLLKRYKADRRIRSRQRHFVLNNRPVRVADKTSAGWGGFRVRRGRIERISLAIPWTKLYTGGADWSTGRGHFWT